MPKDRRFIIIRGVERDSLRNTCTHTQKRVLKAEHGYTHTRRLTKRNRSLKEWQQGNRLNLKSRRTGVRLLYRSTTGTPRKNLRFCVSFSKSRCINSVDAARIGNASRDAKQHMYTLTHTRAHAHKPAARCYHTLYSDKPGFHLFPFFLFYFSFSSIAYVLYHREAPSVRGMDGKNKRNERNGSCTL